MASQNYKEAEEVISLLNEGNFYCDCPTNCGEKINLKDAGLFYLDTFSDEAFKKYKELQQELRDRKKDIPASSEKKAKATNFGNEIEHIAPSLKDFPFKPNDCRFIAEPIDYIIFEGLFEKGVVSKIIFSDIKTGNARLQPNQKAIKELVLNKKIEFKPY